MEEITPEEYQQIRDTRYQSPGYIRWNLSWIRFVMNPIANEEGKTVAIVPKKSLTPPPFEKAILMYYPDRDKQLVVLETTLTDTLLPKVLSKLIKETNAARVVYLLPGGMIYSTDQTFYQEELQENENAYFNLVLA